MALDAFVLRQLENKTGYPVGTPFGSEQLRMDIEKETGVMISINTVKRLTGVIQYDGMPREYTLDIVARFLGYESWEMLGRCIRKGSSGFSTGGVIKEVSSIPVGTVVVLSWPPDRTVKIEHLGESRCRIKESENSKLVAGDIVTIRQIAPGFPLLVSSVERDGVNLGEYTAATETGLTKVETEECRPGIVKGFE